MIEAAKSLKVIGRAGVGVDNVDLAAATRRGVLVMNSPGRQHRSRPPSWPSALMLALARNLAPADSAMKAEKWDRKSFAGVELFGKRLGVIGFGRIGREVAARVPGLRDGGPGLRPVRLGRGGRAGPRASCGASRRCCRPPTT